MSESSFHIRTAFPSDADDVVRLIRGLAQYEKLEHEAVPDAEALRAHLRPDANPRCEALLAFVPGSDRPIGFALFYSSYSTFLTRFGVYLEDLYVEPGFRGKGIGRALFARVVRLARERGCRRVEWSVLDWNESAIDFYLKHGAVPMDEWRTMRLSGKALDGFDVT